MYPARLFTTEVTVGPPGRADGVAVTGTNTYYSTPVSPRLEGISVQLRASGTMTGTWSLWKTNKPDPDLTSDDDWIAIADSLTDPSGSDVDVGEEFGNLRCYLFRVKYVNESGAGTIYGWAVGGQ